MDPMAKSKPASGKSTSLAKPASKSVAKAVLKPATKSAAKSTAKAAVKSPAKAVAKPAAKATAQSQTGLLISVRSVSEAHAALAAGATLIDVKEPRMGPLGIAEAQVVEEIVAAVGKKVPVSAALGEWSPNILTDAVWHLKLPLSYIKWGLAGYRETPGWGEDLLETRRLIGRGPEVVAVAYADHLKAKSIAPDVVAKFARRFKFKAFLLDTFSKDGKSLLQHLKLDQIAAIVNHLQDGGIKVALGGSLTLDAAKKLKPLAPDWFAVRGAVCLGSKRASDIDPDKIRQWKQMLAEN
jgi:(5-formylfuran-3-yl)methyl phosphate synthase